MKRTADSGTERRRVLFVLPSLRGGGTERIMTVLIRHLDRNRFEPHLALLENVGSYLDEIPEDVTLHVLNKPRVRYALPSMLRLVRRLRPHSVLTALYELNLAVASIKPMFPSSVRLYLQEVTTLSAHLAAIGKGSQLRKSLVRRMYSRADRIICKADYIAHDLAKNFGIASEKLIRIYNPLDVAGIRKLAETGPNPLEGDRPHIVAAGRLATVKGFDVLLDAMAKVRNVLPARLTLLGDGPLEKDLKAQSERLGISSAVRFAGFHTSPYPFFKHTDLLVLSSRYEGLPVVILEAMALGTPVVAADCPGGVREILEGCSMGRLVASNNSEALAAGIVTALRERNQSVAQPKECERVLDKFRLEHVMKQYEDLL